MFLSKNTFGFVLFVPPPPYGATVFFSMSPFVSLIWTSRFLYLMIISFEPIIILKNYVWLLFNDWMLNSASLFQLMLWFLLFFCMLFLLFIYNGSTNSNFQVWWSIFILFLDDIAFEGYYVLLDTFVVFRKNKSYIMLTTYISLVFYVRK